jgi:hypothetical protein
MAALGTPDMVIPGYAQQAKTEQDINTLMSKPSVQVTDPQTGQVSMQLPAMPEMDATDYDILYKTVKLFKQKNADYKQKNPQGWARLTAYHEAAKNMEMQEAIEKTKRMQQVKQAGAPPSPESNPAIQRAQQLLLQDAADEVQNLQRISHLPPLGQNGSEAAQVSAGGKILDAATKVAQMQAA